MLISPYYLTSIIFSCLYLFKNYW